MDKWARTLASQNVSEEALVVIRRDRLCVPVKAGRQVVTLPHKAQLAVANVFVAWQVSLHCIVHCIALHSVTPVYATGSP